MNAIDLLKEQLEEVKGLFEKIEKEDDSDAIEDLFDQLADNLAAHSTIEEKIFYPAAYESQTEDLLKEAVEEHLAIKRLVADLMDMAPEDENFMAKITVLKEEVEHHVEEEEGELFKSAKKDLGAQRLKELGARMKALFEETMAENPSYAVPKETKKAASLPPKAPLKAAKAAPKRHPPASHGRGASR
jgi:hypothetical protein